MKEANEPAGLSSAFHSTRNLLVLFSCILFAWQFLGLELTEEIPFTPLKVRNVRFLPHILAVVVLYGLVRLLIEWWQSPAERRQRVASKLDLFLALAAAAAALLPFTVSLMSEVGFSKGALLWLAALVVGGVWVGIMIDMVVYGTLMIRSSDEAVAKGLPRVPAASQAFYLAAVFTVTPVLLITWYCSRWMPAPLSTWWYMVVLVPAVFPPISGLWNLAHFKDSEGKLIPFKVRLQTFREIHDMHDTMYKIGGTSEGATSRGVHPLIALQSLYDSEKDINPKIYTAAETGDTQGVTTQLKSGASPNIVALGGWTPLMIACANGHLDAARLLLDSGAEPDKKNAMGVGALHFAARYSFHDIVKLLVDYGADVNITDMAERQTPLFQAALVGDKRTVEFLLEHGADPNLRDRNDRRALDYAVEHKHGEIAKVLRKVKD